MGQDESTLQDAPPVTLEARTLEAVASHVKSGKVSRIVVLSGAGISTAAGSKFPPSRHLGGKIVPKAN
jgi:NAD+-dependent protein deacetylase SIR2